MAIFSVSALTALATVAETTTLLIWVAWPSAVDDSISEQYLPDQDSRAGGDDTSGSPENRRSGSKSDCYDVTAAVCEWSRQLTTSSIWPGSRPHRLLSCSP